MAFKEGEMRFKIGDLVKSKEHPELLGCVLDPAVPGAAGAATFVKVHWIHPEGKNPPLYNPCYPLKSDLEKVNESR